MRTFLIAAFFLLTLCPFLRAVDEPIRHPVIFFQYGNGCPNILYELDAQGQVVWKFTPPSLAVMLQMLPNGNVLFGYGGKPTGVMEINRKGETVWNYVSKCPQVLGCEREPDGNTLVAEQGPCQAVEVNPKGEMVHITPLQTNEIPFHRQVRNVHKLKNGHILACHEADGAVREYEPDGKVVWEYKNVENCGEALRLENGNTLVAGATSKRILEVAPDGKIAWQFTSDDAPDLNITWISSLQILDNGDILAGNFIRGAEGHGAHAFEVTRDKKVVWKFTDTEHYKSLTTIRAVDQKK
jgi:outer membrane protein assembly factor BamB